MISKFEKASKERAEGMLDPQKRAALRVEALLNASDTRKLCERWVPEHLREKQVAPTTAAGKCFRRVEDLLAGKGQK